MCSVHNMVSKLKHAELVYVEQFLEVFVGIQQMCYETNLYAAQKTERTRIGALQAFLGIDIMCIHILPVACN